MSGTRHRSPGSSRGSARKKRRHHYSPDLETNRELEKDIDIDSDVDSRSSLSAAARDRRRRHHRHHRARDAEQASPDVRRHHHRKAILPAPDGEKHGYAGETTVAVREDYLPMQTVPRSSSRRRRGSTSSSSDEEQVYDHRSRPLSRRDKNRHTSVRPEQQQPPQQSSNADQGFLATAALVMVSLFVCFADAD